MSKPTARRVVELNTEDAEWFENQYPDGSYSWLFSMLLHEFRVANTHTPHDYARFAAEALTDKIGG